MELPDGVVVVGSVSAPVHHNMRRPSVTAFAVSTVKSRAFTHVTLTHVRQQPSSLTKISPSIFSSTTNYVC